MKPRHELLAAALPAVALVLIDWGFWGLRAEQAGWGVNIDGLSLLAAFVVALAVSGPTHAADEPRPALLDGLLHRFASASFGLLAASLCGALFAYLRLSSISLGPALESSRMGGRHILIVLALFSVPPIVWLIRQGVVQLAHAPRAALALAAIALSSWLSLRPQHPGPRLEYLHAAFRTAARLPAMTLKVHIERVTVAGSSFDYLAVANNCVLRPAELQPNRRISEQSVAIPASASVDGFAACPALDILEGDGTVYGVVAGAAPDAAGGKPLFHIDGGRLDTEILRSNLSSRSPTPPGRKIDSIRSIRAPLGITTDRERGAGVAIHRNASDLESCEISVYVDDALLYEKKRPFGGSGKLMKACPPITVTRATSLGILNVHVPPDDTLSAPLETPNATWLDGVGAQRIPLQRVASEVNMPRAWRTGALAGVTCGAFALLVSLVELVRLRRLRGFVAAHHAGGGKIVLEGGGIVDAESARDLEIGEVFVRVALTKAGLPGYREPGQETAHALEVRLPSAVNLEWDRLTGRVTFASATALAFPLATSALLVAARLFGLGG